jgi:UDP-N-acetyl-2-amino-2-deoxyglucuronate dehydrogenase
MIKVGVVGYGRIGKRHVSHIKSTDEMSLDFICDSLENDVDYRSIGDIPSAKGNMNLVSICTPNGSHAEHAKELLSKGYHVLIEKPMTLDFQEALEVIDLAESKNKRVFVVKQNRFNPPVQIVSDLIRSGGLGKILSFGLSCIWNRNQEYYKGSWKGSIDMDGGTLFTQYSHFIDLLLWMFGPMESCNGYKGFSEIPRDIEFEDSGVLSMKMKNGTIGAIHYSVNAYSRNFEGALTIIGEKGTVKIGGQYLNEIDYWDVENLDKPSYDISRKPNEYGQYQGSMSNHDLVYENIREVLLNDAPIKANAIHGALCVQTIESIYKVIK